MKNATTRSAPRVALSSSGYIIGNSSVLPEPRPPAKSPDLFDVFRLRCWANAQLVDANWILLADAVDRVWAAAGEYGLIDRLGADAVQSILASSSDGFGGRP